MHECHLTEDIIVFGKSLVAFREQSDAGVARGLQESFSASSIFNPDSVNLLIYISLIFLPPKSQLGASDPIQVASIRTVGRVVYWVKGVLCSEICPPALFPLIPQWRKFQNKTGTALNL